jgi:hypothetical protein
VGRLVCCLGPASSLGDPLRDQGFVGSGEPAQPGGLAGERLIVSAFAGALEDPGDFGEQVGPAAGELAEFGHRGGLLVGGEVAPPRAVPGFAGQFGDEEAVGGGPEMILRHLARIEQGSEYRKAPAVPCSRQGPGGRGQI